MLPAMLPLSETLRRCTEKLDSDRYSTADCGVAMLLAKSVDCSLGVSRVASDLHDLGDARDSAVEETGVGRVETLMVE